MMQNAIAVAFAALIALPLAITPAWAAGFGGGGHGGGGGHAGGGFHGGAGGFRGGAGGFRGGAGGFRGGPGFRGHGFYGGGFYGGGLAFGPAFDWDFGPFWSPFDYGYYDPYAYAEPPVIVPPVLAPEAGPVPAAPVSQSWYYCSNPSGYFPYVRQCQVPWQTVPAAGVPTN